MTVETKRGAHEKAPTTKQKIYLKDNRFDDFNESEKCKISQNPRFTGLFLPAEIMQLEDLSFLEMILLGWIDALHKPEYGGCFASNKYLAERLKVKENTISKAISHLRDLKLIVDVFYDGRTRIIRSNHHAYIAEVQSKGGLDKNPREGWIKIQGGLDKNPRGVGQKSISSPSSPYYIYNKEDNKEDREETSSPLPPKKTQEKIKFGDYVWFDPGVYEELCNEYSKQIIDCYISKINLYLPNSKRGSYKDYKAAIVNWIKRDIEKGDLKTPQKKSQEVINPEECKEVCLKIEEKVSAIFNISQEDAGFIATPSFAHLYHKRKDIDIKYQYNQFSRSEIKNKILEDLKTYFPLAANKLLGNQYNPSINALISQTTNQFRMQTMR
jgi:hypothetical protein